jgi:multidrug efflux pump subunit AcrA (membrane-fusion protein)
MPNSNEIAKLNQLLSDIKVLVGSLSFLDKATLNKDQVSLATALDAINFRVREIIKTSTALALIDSPTNLKNPTSSINLSVLQIEAILGELDSPMPNIKKLHELMDTQLETLRKIALSEILTLSIE